ncbi:hypothetical protein ACLB2K_012985 [Fragaria x ananassa]
MYSRRNFNLYPTNKLFRRLKSSGFNCETLASSLISAVFPSSLLPPSPVAASSLLPALRPPPCLPPSSLPPCPPPSSLPPALFSDMAANDMVLCVEMETDEMDVPLDLETLPIRAIPPSQDHVFYPQVSNELKPFKGQEFKTWEEAHVFYTKYASAAGFVVRIGSSRRSRKTNEFIRKEFFCNRQGNGPRELTGNEKRIRGVVREDCKARMIVGRVKTGGFVKQGFVHQLSYVFPGSVCVLDIELLESRY